MRSIFLALFLAACHDSAKPDCSIAESCNGIDDDCDGEVDEGVTDAPLWYVDYDADGVGGTAYAERACDAPPGFAATPDDCDDSDSAVHPGADERCDELDDDCDGTIDEDALDAPTWYLDEDGDGFGGTETLAQCTQPAGFAAQGGDCDDTDATVLPGGTELCGGGDEDCDGTVDVGAMDASTWYADEDADGFGDPETPLTACRRPDGATETDTDCDDGNATAYPGADETCDGIDDDCDGSVDEPDALDARSWYADADADGFGDVAVAQVACDEPAGFTANLEDCDDAAPGVNPDAVERCDVADVDENCNGLADDGDPTVSGGSTWFADADADGFGDPGVATTACEQPVGAVADGGDCDDTRADRSPAEVEVCDLVDNDCDLSLPADEADADGDGVATCLGDCDDADPATLPGAAESCDGLDNDCDGTVPGDETDTDGDGTSACAGDCEDGDATMHPGAPGQCVYRVDADCDGVRDCEAAACARVAECCPADPGDDADTIAGAFELAAGQSSTGLLCGADTVDWYVASASGVQTALRYEVCADGGDLTISWNRASGAFTSSTVLDGSCNAVIWLTNAYEPRGWLLVAGDGSPASYTVQLTTPEEDVASECDDGLDNDGDGLTDCEDADCSDWDNDGSPGPQCGETVLVDCDETNPDVDASWASENADDAACTDGIDNDCDGAFDCRDAGCDSVQACLDIGCDEPDQENSEPNDDGWSYEDIDWGERVSGALCYDTDLTDTYRLCGAAEGLEYRCEFEAIEDLGLVMFQARVEDPTDSRNLGAWAFQDWTRADTRTIEDTILDWQAGCWIVQVLPLDTTNDEASNTYSFGCDIVGGAATESDCDDGVDQDLDGNTDCDDSDCTGADVCPCEPTDALACDTTLTLEMASGSNNYVRYPCTGNGYRGPEQVLSFTAPTDGTYGFAASVARYGGRSDDLDLHVLDAEGGCRTGTCLATDNADYLQPVSRSVTLTAGQTVQVVLDGDDDATSDMTVEVEVTCPGSCADADFDGYEAASCGGGDCDDTDPRVRPDAEEDCDGLDSNCNALDEPYEAWFADADGDGYGALESGSTLSCTAPEGYVDSSDDCDDADALVYPGSGGACDNLLDDVALGFLSSVTDWATCETYGASSDLYDSECIDSREWEDYDASDSIVLQVNFLIASDASEGTIRQGLEDQLAWADETFRERMNVHLVAGEYTFVDDDDPDYEDLRVFHAGSYGCSEPNAEDGENLVRYSDAFDTGTLNVPPVRVVVVDTISCSGYIGWAVLDPLGEPFVLLDSSFLATAAYRHTLAHELGHLLGGLQHTFFCGGDFRPTDLAVDRSMDTTCMDLLLYDPQRTCRNQLVSPACGTADVYPLRNMMSYNRVVTGSDDAPYECDNSTLLSDDQTEMFRCMVFEEWSANAIVNDGEDCSNGRDDDGDGYEDCHDFDCGWDDVCFTGAPYCWVDPTSVAVGNPIDQPCCGMTPGGRVRYSVATDVRFATSNSAIQWYDQADETGCVANTWTATSAYSGDPLYLTAKDETTGEWADTVTFRVR